VIERVERGWSAHRGWLSTRGSHFRGSGRRSEAGLAFNIVASGVTLRTVGPMAIGAAMRL